MTDDRLKGSAKILELTTQIVCAQLASPRYDGNTDLNDLIRQVYNTLSSLDGRAIVPPQQRPTKFLKPVVSIGNSVTPDYIICLEDGKKVKMLKRHLKVNYNMEPEEYRKRWGLPDNYPMTAPDYTKHRSALAKSIGLGKKHKITSGE